MSDLYNRIENLCNDSGITITAMCRDSGASRASLSDLKFGRKQKLSADTLSKIARYFNVSIDYLLGNEQEKTPTREGERMTDIEQAKIALFGGDGEVTDEMWEEAIFAAQLIKERHKRKRG